MGVEIERKYLVINDSYKQMAAGSRHIVQGYLSTRVDGTVRVRICDDRAFLTVKSANDGARRGEWEYEIPVVDASEMLEHIDPTTRLIDKTRYLVPADNGLLWEIDEFHGSLAPLVVAEIELRSTDIEVPMPDFIGREVTADARYYNSTLSKFIDKQ